MDIWELVVLGIALSMDAFAVAICKGLSSNEKPVKTGLVCGLWFGAFQALMPFLGWLLGTAVSGLIDQVSSYVAFVLLAFLGVKMIVEAVKEAKSPHELTDEEKAKNGSLSVKVMFVFAIATSIDALAAGVSFAAMKANVAVAVSLIGATTFCLSFLGSALGVKLSERFRTKAEIAGGVILIAMGLKILIEHLITII